MAGRAVVRGFSRPVAARAGDVELHAPAHLRHLASAVALSAGLGAASVRLAVAGGAHFLAIDLYACLAAANRRPEVDRGLVFKIGARLRTARRVRVLRARKNAGENVFEAAKALRARALALAGNTARETVEVEAAEVDRRPVAALALLARVGLGRRGIDLVGVEADLVVNLALLLVAKNVVGLGDLLELLLSLLVARVHVRVIFARSFPESLADLLRRGRLLDAEHRVIVFIGRCGHGCFLISVQSSCIANLVLATALP